MQIDRLWEVSAIKPGIVAPHIAIFWASLRYQRQSQSLGSSEEDHRRFARLGQSNWGEGELSNDPVFATSEELEFASARLISG
jgi:hypothetical protein